MMSKVLARRLLMCGLTGLCLTFSLHNHNSQMARASQTTSDKSALRYTTSWIGNTFGSPKWIQKDGNGLAVSADGRCYVTAGWDEGGKGVGIYKDGDTAGSLKGINVSHGAVTADDQYVFAATSIRDKSNKEKPREVYGIGRWHLDGSPAPWIRDPSYPGTKNFLPIGSEWVQSACLHGDLLFVSDAATDTIRAFDRETLQPRRQFACPHPFRLTADKQGRLWVIQRSLFDEKAGATPIVAYTPDGKPTGQVITDAPDAAALACDPAGNLLVAGPNEQVVRYDIAGQRPRLIGTLGQKGGVYAGTPGVMANDKLLRLWGVGTDAAGNIYTLGRAPATGGGVDLRKFSPGGKMLWQLVSTQFTDVADVDPATDGTDVYTRDEHFVLDYSKPAGAQWTWKGYTLDPAYDDGRVETRTGRSMFVWAAPLVRRLEGRLYLYERPGNYLGIFRKGAGELFVPSGLIDLMPDWMKEKRSHPTDDSLNWPPNQPTQGRWIWRDQNGDGRIQLGEFENRTDLEKEVGTLLDTWVDRRGDIWLCGIRGGERSMWRLPLQGFDTAQNPVYKWDKLQRVPRPGEFTCAIRIQYDSDADVMYLAGTTQEHPKALHFGAAGTEIIRYDHWSKPERAVRWRLALPTETKKPDAFFNAFSVAGKRLFCIERQQSQVHVYDAETGRPLGLITPGPEVGGSTGWCDMPNGLQAFQRKSGEYLLFAEDDYHPKIVVYQYKP